MSRSSARTLGIVLLILGLVLVAVGIVYFTVPVTKLPALLGQLHHGTGHRTKRGIASLGLGVLSLIGTAFAFARSRRHRRHSH